MHVKIYNLKEIYSSSNPENSSLLDQDQEWEGCRGAACQYHNKQSMMQLSGYVCACGTAPGKIMVLEIVRTCK